MRSLGIVMILLTLSACSGVRVQPWERGHLAQQEMQLDGYAIDSFLDEHTYFSKEASHGGAGIGGGGCGCN